MWVHWVEVSSPQSDSNLPVGGCERAARNAAVVRRGPGLPTDACCEVCFGCPGGPNSIGPRYDALAN